MEAVKRINVLFPKYLDQQITDIEWEELLMWMSTLNEEEQADLSHSQKYLWENAKAGKLPSTADKVNWDRVLKSIIASETEYHPQQASVHRVHFLRRSWSRYAAAVLLLVSGLAVWYSRSGRSDKSVAATKTPDVVPGTNKAVLTIGNSEPINLSNHKTGITVGNAVTYNDGERIADAGQMLTLTTPRGGQYQASLPDGSSVWLNAASSIRFPSKFNGSERSIEVTGEVYIEVVKNSQQPFIVHTRNSSVQVLGTSFNINAYEDEEDVKTTLIEGSVRVSVPASGRSGHHDQVGNERSRLLNPGEEAVVSNDDLKVQTVNTSNTIAWVKGYFYFDKADSKTILRQISRWYDLDIVYSGEVPRDLFSGKIERNISLSGVLRLLKQANIETRLEGKKLIIL